MAETNEGQKDDAQAGGVQGDAPDPSRDNEEHELEAEAESAAAMDADVPQPPDESGTTEGQPA